MSGTSFCGPLACGVAPTAMVCFCFGGRCRRQRGLWKQPPRRVWSRLPRVAPRRCVEKRVVPFPHGARTVVVSSFHLDSAQNTWFTERLAVPGQFGAGETIPDNSVLKNVPLAIWCSRPPFPRLFPSLFPSRVLVPLWPCTTMPEREIENHIGHWRQTKRGTRDIPRTKTAVRGALGSLAAVLVRS